MVVHSNMSDTKSPQVTRTHLSILADLNNAVVWMASTRPLISKSSSFFTNPLVTVPRAPISIDNTVTLMFHSFFSSLARSKNLSFLSLSFSFSKVHNLPGSLLLLTITRSVGRAEDYNYHYFILLRVFHTNIS